MSGSTIQCEPSVLKFTTTTSATGSSLATASSMPTRNLLPKIFLVQLSLPDFDTAAATSITAIDITSSDAWIRVLPPGCAGFRGGMLSTLAHMPELQSVSLARHPTVSTTGIAHIAVAFLPAKLTQMPLVNALQGAVTFSIDGKVAGDLTCVVAPPNAPKADLKISVPPTASIPRTGKCLTQVTLTNESSEEVLRDIALLGLPPAVSWEVFDAAMEPIAGSIVAVAAGSTRTVQIQFTSLNAPVGRYPATVSCIAVLSREVSMFTNVSGDGGQLDGESLGSFAGRSVTSLTSGPFEFVVEAPPEAKLFTVVDGLTGPDTALLLFDDVAVGQQYRKRFTLRSLGNAPPFTIEPILSEVDRKYLKVRVHVPSSSGSSVPSSTLLGNTAATVDFDDDETARDGAADGTLSAPLQPDEIAVIDVDYVPPAMPDATTERALEFHFHVLATVLTPPALLPTALDATKQAVVQRAPPAVTQRLRVKCKATVHTSRIVVPRRELTFGAAPLGVVTSIDLVISNPSQVPAAVDIACRSKIISIAGRPPNAEGVVTHRVVLEPASTTAIPLSIRPRRVNPRYRKQLTITGVSNPLLHVVVDLDSNNTTPENSRSHDDRYTCVEVQWRGRSALQQELPQPFMDSVAEGSFDASFWTTSFANVMSDAGGLVHIVAGFPHLRLFKLVNIREDKSVLPVKVRVSSAEIATMTVSPAASQEQLTRLLTAYQLLTSALLGHEELSSNVNFSEMFDDLRKQYEVVFIPVVELELLPRRPQLLVIVVRRIMDPPLLQFTAKEDTLALSLEDDPEPRYIRLSYKICSTVLDLSEQQLNHNFGRINVGDKKTLKVKLRNPAQVPLFLRLHRSKRVSAADLRLDLLGASDHCVVVIQALRNLEFSIVVAPSIKGSFHEALTFTDLLNPIKATHQLTMKAEVERMETFEVAPADGVDFPLQVDAAASTPGDASPAPDSVVAVATAKVLLTNMSKAQRTFVVRAAEGNVFASAPVGLDVKLDVEVVGVSSGTTARLEDEAERLERKIKIYQRKNKVEKLGIAEKRLAKIRLVLEGGDLAADAAGVDPLKGDADSLIMSDLDTESDDDDVKTSGTRAARVRRTATIAATAMADALKRGYPLPFLGANDQAQLTWTVSCPASALYRLDPAVADFTSHMTLLFTEERDKENEKAIRCTVRSKAAVPSDPTGIAAAGAGPKGLSPSTADAPSLPSTIDTAANQLSPGALSTDPAAAAAKRSPAEPPSPSQLQHQQQSPDKNVSHSVMLPTASLAMPALQNNVAAPASLVAVPGRLWLRPAEGAAVIQLSPALIGHPAIDLGVVDLHKAASFEVQVCYTSDTPVNFIVVQGQRLGGHLPSVLDAKFKWSPQTGSTRLRNPFTVLGEVTPRTIGPQKYLICVQNMTVTSELAYMAITFQCVPPDDALRGPDAIDFGVLSLKLGEATVLEHSFGIRNLLGCAVTLAPETTSKLVTLLGGNPPAEPLPNAVTVGAHGSLGITARLVHPPLRDVFSRSRVIRGSASFASLVASTHPQAPPVVLQVHTVPFQCVVTCPAITFVDDAASIDVGRIAVGLQQMLPVTIQSRSHLVPVDFEVTVDGATIMSRGVISVAAAAGDGHGADVSLPRHELSIPICPSASGPAQSTIAVINKTMPTQPPLTRVVHYFGVDKSVSAMPAETTTACVAVYPPATVAATSSAAAALQQSDDSLLTSATPSTASSFATQSSWAIASSPIFALSLSNATTSSMRVSVSSELPLGFKKAGRTGTYSIGGGQTVELQVTLTGMPELTAEQHAALLRAEKVLVTKPVVVTPSTNARTGRRLFVSSVTIPMAISRVACLQGTDVDVGLFGKGGAKTFELSFVNRQPEIPTTIALTFASGGRIAGPATIQLGADETPVSAAFTFTVADQAAGELEDVVYWCNQSNPRDEGHVRLSARMAGTIWTFFQRRTEMQVDPLGEREAFNLPEFQIDASSAALADGSHASPASLSATTGSSANLLSLTDARLTVKTSALASSFAAVGVRLNPLLQGVLDLVVQDHETGTSANDIELTRDVPTREFRLRCVRLPTASLRQVVALIQPSADGEPSLWLGDVVFSGRTSRDEVVRVFAPRTKLSTFHVTARTVALAPAAVVAQEAEPSLVRPVAPVSNVYVGELTLVSLTEGPTTLQVQRKDELHQQQHGNDGGAGGADGASAAGGGAASVDGVRIEYFPAGGIVTLPEAGSRATVKITVTTSLPTLPKMQVVVADSLLPTCSCSVKLELHKPDSTTPSAATAGGSVGGSAGCGNFPSADASSSILTAAQTFGADASQVPTPQAAISPTTLPPAALAPVVVLGSALTASPCCGNVVERAVDLAPFTSAPPSTATAPSAASATTPFTTIAVKIRNPAEAGNAYFALEAVGAAAAWVLGFEHASPQQHPAQGVIVVGPGLTVSVTVRLSGRALLEASANSDTLHAYFMATHFTPQSNSAAAHGGTALSSSTTLDVAPSLIQHPTAAPLVFAMAIALTNRPVPKDPLAAPWLPKSLDLGRIVGKGLSDVSVVTLEPSIATTHHVTLSRGPTVPQTNGDATSTADPLVVWVQFLYRHSEDIVVALPAPGDTVPVPPSATQVRIFVQCVTDRASCNDDDQQCAAVSMMTVPLQWTANGGTAGQRTSTATTTMSVAWQASTISSQQYASTVVGAAPTWKKWSPTESLNRSQGVAEPMAIVAPAEKADGTEPGRLMVEVAVGTPRWSACDDGDFFAALECAVALATVTPRLHRRCAEGAPTGSASPLDDAAFLERMQWTALDCLVRFSGRAAALLKAKRRVLQSLMSAGCGDEIPLWWSELQNSMC